jgi:hypothetical protein
MVSQAHPVLSVSLFLWPLGLQYGAAGAVTVTDCFIVRYQTNVQQQNNTNSLESYTTKCHLCSLFLLTLDWAGIQQYIYIDGDCDTILRLAVMWFKRIETARS